MTAARNLERPTNHSALRRAAILATAEDLFAESGYAATSMRDVAAAADVNVSTIYYHCGSKQQLFMTIYEAVMGRLGSWTTEGLGSGGEYRDIVAGLIDRVLLFFIENPNVPRLLWFAGIGDVPKAAKPGRQVYSGLFETVGRVMNDRAEAGEVRRVDPAVFIAGSSGVMLNLALDATAAGASDEAIKKAQDHARMFIMGGLGMDPSPAGEAA